MKTFVILEKYVGYADVTIEAETEQEAIDLYNEGSYSDDATEFDDMFYDFEFVEIKELTDDQFETLFHFVDERVEDIVDRSVQFQDSEILEDWEDLLDVHTLLENVKVKYETKLQIAQAKQPDMEW